MVSIRCIPDQLSNITYKFPSSKVLYGLYENLKKIQECKQVCIFEGEKSVLKSKTLFGENDISVASFGCNLSQYHLELLKSLGVNTLMFCYDREIEERIFTISFSGIMGVTNAISPQGIDSFSRNLTLPNAFSIAADA